MPNATSNTTSVSTSKPAAGMAKALPKKFSGFLNSLGDVLLDITALEVNTMIVANITGSKFNADTAYRSLYAIPEMGEDHQYDDTYFRERGIPEVLHQRYMALRRGLSCDYRAAMQGDDPNRPLGSLPDPDLDVQEFHDLLANSKFLRSLRKLIELKAALTSESERSAVVDVIYAQTVLQLDGDVINRYHQELFQLEENQKRLILDIHNQGVTAGESQWRSLLEFMVSLVQGIIRPSNSNIVLFPQNGQQQPPS